MRFEDQDFVWLRISGMGDVLWRIGNVSTNRHGVCVKFGSAQVKYVEFVGMFFDTH